MARKLRIYLSLLILIFPVATYLLGIVNASNGLVWLALDTGYYYPVYVITPSLFKKLEMGLLVPMLGGRLLAFLLYLLSLLLFFKMKDKLFPN
ncbi:hypothetical protein L6J37_10555 [Photobacterium sp. WH77]|uniref:hypothetical protein n=1 Tax=unclassified Photobacterium TaxID=2628852 RepID=UPI001EF1549A|nr:MULTISPECIES: hypothetical protein [unclassified Photobacterium]MCG2837273.1 hypothetical protein [Photobacterium sp. WH77]MCG2844889.1 hypothetical protein [Photobacterium sp. WH80]MDO6583424.1 hypothetical protein [Photobacterium sp. 2_MG-2023]UIP30049.1 hypothetical protein LN341_21105 [Photobacterium sp. TLY01]